MLPIECVVRGYLAGSGWKEYRGDRHGLRPAAARRAASRPTSCPSRSSRPATKAESGHDENIDRDAGVATSSARSGSPRLERLTLALYSARPSTRVERGIIIADTKFEFGVDGDGRLILIDEVLTPDSSRFWPADAYAPGGSPPSFDKQYVRDWLETLGWDKTPPGAGAAARGRRGHRGRATSRPTSA